MIIIIKILVHGISRSIIKKALYNFTVVEADGGKGRNSNQLPESAG